MAVGGSASAHFVGANVFSITGAGQVRDITVKRGGRKTAYVRIQNQGIVAAMLSAHFNGGAHGIKASYFRGSTNVTSALENGTFTTGSVAPGAFVLLRVVVRVGHGSADNTTFVVSARASGASPDAVRIKVAATH